MRYALLCTALAAVSCFAAENDSPSGNRTTPPTISSVSPRGVARGTTLEMTVEGFNLAKASAIYFDKTGVKGKILRIKELPDQSDIRIGSNGTASSIDLGPLPPRNQVTVEIDIDAEAEIGPVAFRLLTPIGTSPEGKFLIEPYYGESPDREPNNTPEQAFETYLPTILVGDISKSGDVDYYKINVKDGERLVFENGGMFLGSTLQPLVTILREDQSVVKEFGYRGGSDRVSFTHKFDKGGAYYIRVSDYEESGRASNFYRIKVGNFPLVTSAYPLGLQKGKTEEIALKGWDLDSNKIAVKGEPNAGQQDSLMLRPAAAGGKTFNEVKLAVGRDPEILSAGKNTSLSTAQPIATPATINGKITAPVNNLATENYYKFHARKNEKLVLEVTARRLGSELDSLIEILDARGKPVEVATVRPTWETSTVLRDHDSAQRGVRLASTAGLEAGDYMLAGNEVMRISETPLMPDADVIMDGFNGQREAYLGTSPEAHASDQPIYKAQILPPGVQPTPNGLPVAHMYARNDDGGPGYGKDSYLQFTAAAEGDYFVKIRDVRGEGGDDYAYRLNIRPPRPDFRLQVTPANPNVPLGGTIPVTVTAFRTDGFDGKIDVALEDVPPGLTATKGVIQPNQIAATLLLSADKNAKLEGATPLKVSGHAVIENETVARYADPEDHLKLIALMPTPDILMNAETKEITLEPGSSIDVSVSIQRNNEFGGRVPVEVRNLPPRVRVLDVGLNGVLINENEKQRSFKIEALPSAQPIEQWIYVSGRIETRSPLATSYAASQPILLRIKPRTQMSASK
jgi:hypothetical protein